MGYDEGDDDDMYKRSRLRGGAQRRSRDDRAPRSRQPLGDDFDPVAGGGAPEDAGGEPGASGKGPRYAKPRRRAYSSRVRPEERSPTLDPEPRRPSGDQPEPDWAPAYEPPGYEPASYEPQSFDPASFEPPQEGPPRTPSDVDRNDMVGRHAARAETAAGRARARFDDLDDVDGTDVAAPGVGARSDTAFPRPPAAARQHEAYQADAPQAPQQAAAAASGVDPAAGLVVSHIGKAYKKRPVVKDVSLGVHRGEIVGLLGPNGAGKTTCFYMITGLIPADRGSITLQGADVTRLPMYRRARLGLGYLPQEASIFRGLTVEQNIRATLELAEPSRHKREQRLDQLLAEFSISRLRRTPAVALSGGERRRVEIARALAANPSFILLDEPFAGVDPIAVGDIRSLVWQLKDRGIGVLITDHNVRETLEIIDRAYILHDGRVLMEGAPEDVVNDENVRRVYLGEGFRI